MMLSRLESLYNLLNSLGPQTKTIIIIILSIIVIEIGFRDYTKLVLQDFTE